MRFFLIGFGLVVATAIVFVLVNVALMYAMEWMWNDIVYGKKEDR